MANHSFADPHEDRMRKSKDRDAISSNVENAKLAQKRARDRRSQQAMRDRQKREMDALRAQVAQLLQLAREAEDLNSQHPLPGGLPSPNQYDAIEKLQRENEMLRQQLAQVQHLLPAAPDAGYAGFAVVAAPSSSLSPPRRRLSRSGIVIDASVLQSWSSSQTTASRTSPTVSISQIHNAAPAPPHASSFALSDAFDAFPAHIPPTCPSDRIVQPFIEEQRHLLRPLRHDARSARPEPDPHLAYQAQRVRAAITKVAADILATYCDIGTLPKRVACLFAITSVLNVWLVFQTREAFEQMPVWLRPCPAQVEIPHPAWIDRVQWPRVRDYLVRHQDVTFDQYTDAFLSFDLNWSYDEELVLVAEKPSESAPEAYAMSPVFEEHVRNMGNWTVGARYWHLYPFLAKAVEEDIRQFKSGAVNRQYWAMLNT